MQYLIRNWGDFQHYKSGRGAPPWIKLYRGILNDKEWHALPPDAAKFLVSCWVLAAENNGYLPDIETISFRLRLASKDVARMLINCSHWIITNASDALSTRYSHATPETETETETETDIEKDSLSGKPDGAHVNGKKKLSESCLEVLNFLNEKTGRNYQPVKANINLIACRLREGATVDQCRQVIAKKCREWRDDPSQEIYLRPKTLFNATNFAQYQGELG